MKATYFEVTITPSGYHDIILSYLIDIFPHAIEESEERFILRSEEPLTDVITQVEEFCRELSGRVGEEVSCKVRVEERQNIDWIEEYKRSVLPVACGPFYVRPSWHEPQEGMIDLLIDPALAFGSGHHPSTCGVLQMIADCAKSGAAMLDVGCGSGILAIAAAKLGMKVSICDTDPLALDASRENFEKNHVCFEESWVGSANRAKRDYDLVAANIVADILMLIASDLKKCLAPGGTLILSGIVKKYQEAVLAKYADLVCDEVREIDEWVTLRLSHPGTKVGKSNER
ncbi:MAG: 50S ribosomal protein L11 methyltransferase [Campylobacterales bacterium]